MWTCPFLLVCRACCLVMQHSWHGQTVQLLYSLFDIFRFVVHKYPEAASLLEEEEMETEESLPGPDPLNGACQFSQPEPSPFCTRKVMYENEEVGEVMSSQVEIRLSSSPCHYPISY